MNHHATVDPTPPARPKRKAARKVTLEHFDFLTKKMTGDEFNNYLQQDGGSLPEDLLPALEQVEA